MDVRRTRLPSRLVLALWGGALLAASGCDNRIGDGRTLNLIDRRNYPELSRRLMDALGLGLDDIAAEARAYVDEKTPA